MAFQTLDDVSLAGVRALVRVDFNVPMADGAVTDDTRLRAAVPTIEKLRAGGAKVILLAHFDRPKGKWVPEMSLAPIAPALSAVLGRPVTFVPDCAGKDVAAAVSAMARFMESVSRSA
jgi:phosphoglycerate kinase